MNGYLATCSREHIYVKTLSVSVAYTCTKNDSPPAESCWCLSEQVYQDVKYKAFGVSLCTGYFTK